MLSRSLDINNRLDTVLPAIKQTLKDLNSRGFVFYEKRDWDAAIDCFEKAIQADKKNSFAHYNLACTLALKAGRSADETTLKKIVLHLNEACRQDDFWAVSLMLDPDLALVRENGRRFSDWFPSKEARPDAYLEFYPDGRIVMDTAWTISGGMGPRMETHGPGWDPLKNRAPTFASYSTYYCVIGGKYFMGASINLRLAPIKGTQTLTAQGIIF